jgi:hypothetical protein
VTSLIVVTLSGFFVVRFAIPPAVLYITPLGFSILCRNFFSIIISAFQALLFIIPKGCYYYSIKELMPVNPKGVIFFCSRQAVITVAGGTSGAAFGLRVLLAIPTWVESGRFKTTQSAPKIFLFVI